MTTDTDHNISYLIKSSICRSEDSEGSGTSEVLHHAGGLQGGVEGGEVLVLGDQGGHALPGLIDGSRGLGGGAGDGVDVGTAEVVGRVGSWGTDWQVVVESSDRPGVVGQHSLGGQEWVEGLESGVSSSRIKIIISDLRSHERIMETLGYLDPRMTLLPELVCASEAEVSSGQVRAAGEVYAGQVVVCRGGLDGGQAGLA